jgi:hypothetical protein
MQTPENNETPQNTKPAMNGFIHPHTNLTCIMTDEDREAQMAHIREILKDLNPKGALEHQLAKTIALDTWRLNRIKTVEENIFAHGQILPTKHFHHEIARAEHAVNHAWTYLQHSRVIDRLSLYESRLNRIVAKNLDLLLRLQANRQQRERDARKHPAPIEQPLTQTASASASLIPKTADPEPAGPAELPRAA